MHLKIAHQLALLLAGMAVLVVTSVGGLTLWNLRSGFADYLRQRDDEQLMRLVKLVEWRAARDPELNWLRHNEREAMRELMDEFYGRPYHPPRQRDPGVDHPPPGARARPPAAPPPPAVPGGALRDRVLIRDAHGRWVAGRDQPADAPRSIRAIKVNHTEVGTIALAAEPLPDLTDLNFLRKQYTALGLATLGTVMIALVGGFWLASRWSRPLRHLQHASRSIAQGRRDVYVQPAGALEMAELGADINTMTAELSRLETTRRTWIAQISHELRTPLSVLRGEIESIEDGVRQPTPAILGRLRDEVNQLTRLVDDLHTLSVADMDGLRCTFAPVTVGTALADVVNRFKQHATKAGLTLTYLPPDDNGQLVATWDVGRIQQLLANLLTNSMRYTQPPGRVTVTWVQKAGNVLLSVDDTAPGVSHDDLPRLFDPLFRTDASRQRSADKAHASGLGLSIVRSIVQAHHGQVSAHPSPLGGLSVQVTLPLHPDATHTSAAVNRRKP